MDDVVKLLYKSNIEDYRQRLFDTLQKDLELYPTKALWLSELRPDLTAQLDTVNKDYEHAPIVHTVNDSIQTEDNLLLTFVTGRTNKLQEELGVEPQKIIGIVKDIERYDLRRLLVNHENKNELPRKRGWMIELCIRDKNNIDHLTKRRIFLRKWLRKVRRGAVIEFIGFLSYNKYFCAYDLNVLPNNIRDRIREYNEGIAIKEANIPTMQ